MIGKKKKKRKSKKAKSSIAKITSTYTKLFSVIDKDKSFTDEVKSKIKTSIIEITILILENRIR